jgi:streptogramin lyase
MKLKRWRVVLCAALLAGGSTFVGQPALAAGSPLTWAAPVRIVHQPPFTSTNLNGMSTIAGTITEFPIPNSNSSLTDIAKGPDGNLWFTGLISGKVGRITTGGASTEFPIPSAGGPNGIAAGPDGNLWFTELYANSIGRITPGGVITEFPIPTAGSSPSGIAAGPDGNLWFTEQTGNKVGRITTAGAITEFPIPTAGSSPSGIAAGPDGNLWFTEEVGTIGRITTGGAITEFPMSSYSGPSGIAAGPDGNLWFTEPTAIGRITTAGAITSFPIPSSGFPSGIAAGPDGNLWFTETNQGGTMGSIGRITTAGVITEFPISSSSSPIGITAGPDGNLWFIEGFDNSIGRITTGGAITEFPVPGDPGGISAGGDGNLWFTEAAGKIGRITTAGVITEFLIPSVISHPNAIAAGPDGNLWFTEQSGNKVGRITTTGAITEFAIPTAGRSPSGIAAGPDGNLWFTESTGSYIGRITTAGVITEFPATGFPTGITAGPDGNLWFTESSDFGGIGRITTAGVVTTFPIPTTTGQPTGIAAGPDGNLWFTEQTANNIGRITTAGVITEFPISTASGLGSPIGIAAGPDGNLWFTNYGQNIGQITTAGVITEFPASGFPTGIAAGPDGNLWFTEQFANQIGRINTGTLLPAVAVLPAMTNGAYGGYITAATIQNTGMAPAAVRIDYFDQNGAPVGTGDSISSLPVNASWTVRQDNGNSFPSSGGDAAQAGSAVVYSSQPVAAFVNEFAPGNVGDATSYSGVQVPSGVGPTLYAPTIVNNAYGGYTTGIGLLNEGSSATDVTINYRDGNGVVVKTQSVTALAAHAYQALYSGDATLALPSGFAGTATITSSAGQSLGAVVNEVGPGGQFSSYDAVPSGGTALNAPVALNNAFGGYYTGMGIQNTTGTAGSVTVTYYDASGTPTVKSFGISANGSLGVYQGSATDGPAVGPYTATITSSVAIAAIVNEVAPSSTSAKQSTSYNAFNAGSASLNLPLVENAGSDPWNTGEGIMNTGTASTTVTVNYFNTASGAAVGTPQSLTLSPHAFWGLYQPTGGLPGGTRATAVITTSSGGQVAAICNESSTTTFMSYDGQ